MIYRCWGKLEVQEGTLSPAEMNPVHSLPSSEDPQEQQEELREQTPSSHQHKTSLLCISRRCNCFQPFWMSKISDNTDWHWLKKHELSTGVTARGWQDCAAAASNYNFRVIITKETSDPPACEAIYLQSCEREGSPSNAASTALKALTQFVCGCDNIGWKGGVQICIQDAQWIELCYMMPSNL